MIRSFSRKKTAAVVLLALVLVLSLCFSLVLLPAREVHAEDDLGTITVHNHDDNQIGITIEGVTTETTTTNVFDQIQDSHRMSQYGKFLRFIFFNGQPLFNTQQTSASAYNSGNYGLGGYTYLMVTGRGRFNEGDVLYFKKGFTPLYYQDDTHNWYDISLKYDRYFVFDGYEFQPAEVLQKVTPSADYVSVDGTITLTPEFLPINYYKADDPSNKVNEWENELNSADPDEDANFFHPRLSKEMNYVSSDTAVAEVDASTGVVTGKKPGRVTITATHTDSNESIEVEIVVRGSETELSDVTLSVSEGKPVIAGTAAEAVASVPAADNAFFNLITINGEPLTGVSASIAADGSVTLDKQLSEGDVIRFIAGWQNLTASEGAAALADGTLTKDVYYRYNGTGFEKITPFTLSDSELTAEVRTEPSVTATFDEAIADQQLVWTSSDEEVLTVDSEGNLFIKSTVTDSPVTVTAKHLATGAEATCSVTVKETMEGMNVDIVTVDSKTIGINFTGATSGRKIVSDYMNDIQGKYDVRGGKAAGDANIYFAFFRKFWMNAVGHVATLPTAEVWGAGSGGLHTNTTQYSLTFTTNYYDFQEGDIIFMNAGLRPIAYKNGVGYYFDSMTLQCDLAWQFTDGEFVPVSPESFSAQTYTVKEGGTAATSLNHMTAGWTSTLWDLIAKDQTGALGGPLAEDTTWTYSIEDTSVATVDASTGVITGVKAGETTITATNAGGRTATAKVVVNEKTEVTLPQSVTVTYGEEQTIEAETNNASASFVWSAENDEIVTVTGDGASAKVTGDALGKTTVTVVADGESTATISVTVVPSIEVELTSDSLPVGETLQIPATVLPSEGVTVTYASSDDEIATVSSSGLITAAGEGDVTITVTAAASGDASVKAEYEIELNVYEVKDFTITSANTVSGGAVQFLFDSNKGDIVATEGMQSVIYLEANKDDLPDFFQKIIVTDPEGGEMTLADYWWDEFQIQIHTRNNSIDFHWYTLPKDDNGDWILTQESWVAAVPRPGTIITLQKGMRPIWGNRDGNYYTNYRLAEDISFVYENGVWRQVVEEGGPFRVVSVEPIDKTTNQFAVTFNVVTTESSRGEALADSELILFNGYSMAAINAQNPEGVRVMLFDDTATFALDPDVVMDGEKIFDLTNSSAIVTLQFLQGFTFPTGYTCEEEYLKVYYADVEWWSGERDIPESDVVLEIDRVVQSNETSGDTINHAFRVYFGNDEKVIEKEDSGAAGYGTVYMNAVPEWFNLTNWNYLLDHQITSGVKNAVWHGIYINGRSVYDIMFNSGASTIELQSTIVAVHFQYGDNSLRIVFDSRCDTINGIDWTKEVTLLFDADVFYTDTGAKFAEDTLFVYDPATETWSRREIEPEYEYTITMDETASVEAGKTVTISASVSTSPSGGDTSLSWATSDSSIATVSNGVVTGIKAGTVTITATAADGTSKTCTVTVTAAQSGGEPGTPDPDPGQEEGGGCSSAVGTAGAVCASLALLGAAAAIIIFRKKAE